MATQIVTKNAVNKYLISDSRYNTQVTQALQCTDPVRNVKRTEVSFVFSLFCFTAVNVAFAGIQRAKTFSRDFVLVVFYARSA